MKIYTKTGDKGYTSLIGGTRVPKHHPRIEAYGDMDELNSWIGLLREIFAELEIKKTLLEIQNHLFTAESHLASNDPEKVNHIPPFHQKYIEQVESEIDRLNDLLTPLESFILPGGSVKASYCHIARTVCRRVERRVVELNSTEPVNSLITEYINRLSDYLFTLARVANVTHEGIESHWLPRS